MQACDSLTAFVGEEEGHVTPIVLEEIFREDGRTGRMSEHIEVGLQVAVAIRLIHAERHLLLCVVTTSFFLVDDANIRAQVGDGCIVEAFRQQVSLCLTTRRITAPSASAMPFAVIASTIDVDRDVETVFDTILLADFVDLLCTVHQFC